MGLPWNNDFSEAAVDGIILTQPLFHEKVELCRSEQMSYTPHQEVLSNGEQYTLHMFVRFAPGGRRQLIDQFT
jgi:hypothetical protein